MKILELCLSNALGGLELYVFRAAKALQNKHHTVLAVVTRKSQLDDYFQQHSAIKIEYLKRHNNPLPLCNAKKLAKIIDENNIDIIHLHWGKDLPLAAFARAFSKHKPALVYTRQMVMTRKKDDFYHNFLYGQMDLMLTITRELETLCKKYIPRYANKIITLYNGVEAPAEFLDKQAIKQQRKNLCFSANDFIVGIIGRIEKNKGQHLLIEAIHKAKQNGHNIKALIVGHEMNTGYIDELKNLAKKLGITDEIIFHDFTNQPQVLMQICDCVTLATYRETFGLVLPEAMRSGIAVTGSNRSGVLEIIKHEKTGLLFTTKDADSLYQQIERYYLEPDFRIKMAQQGKQDADKRFNETLHFNQLEKHLLSCIN